MIIRHVEDKDLDAVTILNNIESKWVGVEERGFFEKYKDIPHFYVATETDGTIVGIIMAMDESVEYGSRNFIWFKDRYDHFLYIDRIIIAPDKRRQGIGQALYTYLVNIQREALTCEVAINPLNEESVHFHENYGFEGVGEFSARGTKLCRMYRFDSADERFDKNMEALDKGVRNFVKKRGKNMTDEEKKIAKEYFKIRRDYKKTKK